MPYIIVGLVVAVLVVMMLGESEIEFISLQFIGLVVFWPLILAAVVVLYINDKWFAPKP